MQRILISLLLLGFLKPSAHAQTKMEAKPTVKIKYPITKKVSDADEYYGQKVADPYRWLENDKAPEVAKWVSTQNEVTNKYLQQIPFKEQIKKRLTNLWSYARQGAPFKKGNYYFYTANNGTQNQNVLYVKQSVNGESRVLLDPNMIDKEGTTSLSDYSFSKNAKYMAYSLSKAGSDWSEINVLDVNTGEKLKDKIEWVKFSNIAWRGNGFYYSRYDIKKDEKGSPLSNKNEFHKVYYHELGQPTEQDKLVYQDKEHPTRNHSAQITEDESLLIISVTEGTSGNALYVKKLNDDKTGWIKIVDSFESDYSVVDKIGGNLLVLTNHDAPNNKLVFINPDQPETQDWKKVIPETKELLEMATTTKEKIIVKYLKDVCDKVYVYNMNGERESEIVLPGLGKVDALNSDRNDSLVFYTFLNFTNPSSVYSYSLNTKKSKIEFTPKVDFNISDYETKQVFYPSKDGVKIPMFITMKKGTKLDGKNPCFLYGYGGFNVSYSPEFRPDRILFLENGGILAVANLRGGGEYGETWHKNGTKMKKQNVFNDFISAAEYLVKEKYTTHDKLAIHGRSNGGLLIGAVITQRPDIAKVALPAVGVLDMLRYHKFTIGWAWAVDYGTSEESEEMFKYLYAYSPIHNVKDVEYPATLVTTADHDDRVVPAHSFKFISQLQAHQKGANPTLIRIDVNAGHGSGKPISKLVDEWTDQWSFVFYNLGIIPKN